MGKDKKGGKKKGGKPGKASHVAPAQGENPSDTPLFRSVLKAYDEKQYKKGVKSADQLLAKYPNHGETLAMKGLLVSGLGKDRKEEAYALVRQGLKLDLQSYTCWHVLGLLYRADSNYDEAIKCYKQALRIDKDNLQILRDLANLQVHQRDLGGFKDTCLAVLRLKPKLRYNWVELAVAHCLLGDYDRCVKVIQNYKNTLDKLEENNYEHSEMILYENEMLERCPNVTLEATLKALRENQKFIQDKMAYREREAALLVKLEQWEEADKHYRTLLGLNGECHQYIDALATIHKKRHQGEKPDDELVVDLFESLKKEFSDSMAARRLQLNAASGAVFAKLLAAYISDFLRKGIPSLFSSLKSLYKNPDKVAVMDKVFGEFETSMRTSRTFPGSTDKQKDSVLQWVLQLQAQHHDKKRNFDQALGLIDEAIALDASTLELYIAKARILKHMGDYAAAVQAIDHARVQDPADRWYNSKTTLYRIRCDEVGVAEDVIAKFSRPKGEKSNLVEMQCVWWATECGRAYLRMDDLPRALKQFHTVHKHFGDYVEDQFDFHSYCVRKMTLRVYVRLLAFEDSMYSYPSYVKAALGGVEAYLRLASKPKGADADEQDEELKGLSEKERKKVLSKRRREEARLMKEKEKVEGKKSGKENEDEDPNGEALAAVEDPLKEACTVFLQKLETFARDWMETHVLACDVYLKRGKFLLALRALSRGLALLESEPDSRKNPASARARLLVCLHAFVLAYAKEREGLPAFVQSIVDEVRGDWLSDKAIADAVKKELDANKHSLPHLVAGLEIDLQKNAADTDKRVAQWAKRKDTKQAVAACTAVEVREAVQRVGRLSQASAASFKDLCRAKWPRASFLA